LKQQQEKFIRTLFVVWCIGTYLAGFILSLDGEEPGFTTLMTWGTGLVAYIIAASTAQIMHFRDRGAAWYLLPALLYPLLVYYLLFHRLDYFTGLFWQFLGAAYFLMTVGGFMMGILFAPMIAACRARLKPGAALKFYLAGMKAGASAMVFCLAVLAAAFYIAYDAFRAMHFMSAVQVWKYIFYMAAGMMLMLSLTYRHTLFGMAEKNLNKHGHAPCS
jgi:hypothetical protein